MKKYILKHIKRNKIKIVIVCFAFFILIPLLINYIYRNGAICRFLNFKWSAGDMIQFYGAIIGGVLTVYGVYLTINYTQSNYEDDIRNRVLPYIAFNFLEQKTIRGLLEEEIDVEDDNMLKIGMNEFDLEEIYFVVNNGMVEAKLFLTKDQKRRIINGGVINQHISKGVTAVIDSQLIYQTIILENVGVGAAIQARVGFNKAECSDPKFCKPMTLKRGDNISVHIYADDCNKDSKNLCNYSLGIEYSDIYGNKYIQEMPIELGYDIEENQNYISINYDVKQKRVL